MPHPRDDRRHIRFATDGRREHERERAPKHAYPTAPPERVVDAKIATLSREMKRWVLREMDKRDQATRHSAMAQESRTRALESRVQWVEDCARGAGRRKDVAEAERKRWEAEEVERRRRARGEQGIRAHGRRDVRSRERDDEVRREWRAGEERERRARAEGHRRARAERERQQREWEKAERRLIEKRAMRDAWRVYEEGWRTIGRRPLTFETMVWPMAKSPRALSDITASRIASFLLSPAHSEGASPAQRIQDALLRWRPDLFESALGAVVAGDKAMVWQGCGVVVRCLNEIMRSMDRR
ncbi:hypothetical protein EW146_g8847 [Bondarzewia mesenterica]|uniref:Uncharacterized protein n=1 Tax=Bondarzewia mesenterica TaxID=1095465 RepID=A0A4S4LB20_9AGAM|nr:hypothetical protein EW146_g8847 [Bondarzewia mesenterica]